MHPDDCVLRFIIIRVELAHGGKVGAGQRAALVPQAQQRIPPSPHTRRGAPYPREVWVDRPVWGLGVRQACDPSSELGVGGRRPAPTP